ncbi:hypothetical protein ON010_g9541 [Phytophthora cinnamomi]|nr:hypothetical protein ON010_g9541 [Phytophthora cinnamomi]
MGSHAGGTARHLLGREGHRPGQVHPRNQFGASLSSCRRDSGAVSRGHAAHRFRAAHESVGRDRSQQTLLGAGVLLFRGDDVPRHPPVPNGGADGAVVPYRKGRPRHAPCVGGDGCNSLRSHLVDWVSCAVHDNLPRSRMADADCYSDGGSMGEGALSKTEGGGDAHRHGQVVDMRLLAGLHLPAVLLCLQVADK